MDVLDVSTGELTTLPTAIYRADAPSPHAWLQSLAWNPGGDRLAFCVVFDAYPAEVIVADLGGADVSLTRLDRPEGVHVKGYGTPLAWKAEALYWLGETAGHVFVMPPTVRHLPTGGVVHAFAVGGDALAFVRNDTTTLPDIFNAEGRKLTDVNPQIRDWALPTISHVTWPGADGVEVGGILELPPGYRQGSGPLPLIVCIHGGPTTADHAHLRFWIYGRTLLASNGYAVLCPNYRGSTGYGDRFLTDLVGRENDLDVRDILGGVDALIERGIADPDRLGVSGWSNGGYLTNCLITRTDRFKAASSGAGILDTAMEWGINDEPAYPMVFKTGFPWDKPREYQRTSPSWDMGKIRTPTLIHVGANDVRCPPEHSRMLYRALKHYLDVPTELLEYPNEAHGLMKYRSRKAKLEWDLAWFDRYVLGSPQK